MESGLVVAVPIPEDQAADAAPLQRAQDQALQEAVYAINDALEASSCIIMIIVILSLGWHCVSITGKRTSGVAM
jgi:pseudouridine-5'-phosphate glycosidase